MKVEPLRSSSQERRAHKKAAQFERLFRLAYLEGLLD